MMWKLPSGKSSRRHSRSYDDRYVRLHIDQLEERRLLSVMPWGESLSTEDVLSEETIQGYSSGTSTNDTLLLADVENEGEVTEAELHAFINTLLATQGDLAATEYAVNVNAIFDQSFAFIDDSTQATATDMIVEVFDFGSPLPQPVTEGLQITSVIDVGPLPAGLPTERDPYSWTWGSISMMRADALRPMN